MSGSKLGTTFAGRVVPAIGFKLTLIQNAAYSAGYIKDICASLAEFRHSSRAQIQQYAAGFRQRVERLYREFAA